MTVEAKYFFVLMLYEDAFRRAFLRAGLPPQRALDLAHDMALTRTKPELYAWAKKRGYHWQATQRRWDK